MNEKDSFVQFVIDFLMKEFWCPFLSCIPCGTNVDRLTQTWKRKNELKVKTQIRSYVLKSLLFYFPSLVWNILLRGLSEIRSRAMLKVGVSIEWIQLCSENRTDEIRTSLLSSIQVYWLNLLVLIKVDLSHWNT